MAIEHISSNGDGTPLAVAHNRDGTQVWRNLFEHARNAATGHERGKQPCAIRWYGTHAFTLLAALSDVSDCPVALDILVPIMVRV